MKTSFYLVLFVVVSLLAGWLAFQLYNGYQTSSETTANISAGTGTVSQDQGIPGVNRNLIPSKETYRTDPPNDLGVWLAYGHEISPGEVLTEAWLDDAMLAEIAIDSESNSGYLTFTKESKTIELPVEGVVGLNDENDGSSDTVTVSSLPTHLEKQGIYKVRMSFAGSNIGLSNSEIVQILEAKLKDDPQFELMMQANRKLGVKGLDEVDFLNRLNDDNITFEPEELLIFTLIQTK